MSEQKRKRRGRVAQSEKPTTTWGRVRVKCPFYKGETNYAICCEGTDKRRNARRLFEAEEKKMQMLDYCCKNYELCPWFQKIYSAY